MFTPHDLQVLSNYHFIEEDSNKQNDKLIGVKWVKKEGKWSQQLVEVSRQDVTCWYLFLSLLGIGKLKNTSVYLDNVCSYLLSQYEWKEIRLNIQDKEEASDEYQAFKTVCHLANRQMQRNYSSLFKAISDPIVSDFNHYWNPVMDGRTLRGLQRYRLPDARHIELRFIDTQDPVPPYQVLTEDDVANIEVGFAYELITQEETIPAVDDDDTDDTIYHYYHHFPNLPYYKVSGYHDHLPTRNEF